RRRPSPHADARRAGRRAGPRCRGRAGCSAAPGPSHTKSTSPPVHRLTTSKTGDVVCQRASTATLDSWEGVTVVRAAADRGFLPVKNLLEEVGDMMILTGKTIMSALRPPYPYGGGFVSQFLFALKLCWFPLLVSTVGLGCGGRGLKAVDFLVWLG